MTNEELIDDAIVIYKCIRLPPDWSSNPATKEEEIPELEELDYEPPILTDKEKELLRRHLNKRITGKPQGDDHDEAFDRAMRGI